MYTIRKKIPSNRIPSTHGTGENKSGSTAFWVGPIWSKLVVLSKTLLCNNYSNKNCIATGFIIKLECNAFTNDCMVSET